MNPPHAAAAIPSAPRTEAPAVPLALDGLEAGRVTPEALGLVPRATVPRFLVHKFAVHEVLLTEHRRLSETSFALSAQVPVMHGFYADGRSEYHDLMLLTELLRQAGILLAHEYHGVPFGHMFVFRGLGFAVHDVGATRIHGRAQDALLLVEISDKRDYRGALGGYVVSTRIFLGGIEAAGGWAGVNFMAPDAYSTFRDKVRSGRDFSAGAGPRVAPGDPRACGKHDPRNAVLSELEPAGDGWDAQTSVLVDLGHRCLFDHELDHIPGMLLLEAAKQMAVATVSERTGEAPELLVPASVDGTFKTFAELELPLRCRARVKDGGDPAHDGREVAIELLQPDMTVSDGLVRVLSVGEAAPAA
jgi:2-oxo-3-(phosphooxy)propyl 3-oxoalkanoate synthase